MQPEPNIGNDGKRPADLHRAGSVADDQPESTDMPVMSEQGTQFVIVLEHGFTMQAFSSAIEVLRLARRLGGEAAPSYTVAAIGNAPVHASNGIAVLPDRDIDDLPRHAVLVVVSGSGVHSRANPDLISRLRLWDRRGHRIWAISSGVVRLAQAGLADGTTVSAHWEDVPYLKENHRRVAVSTSLFIGKGKYPTCSGGGAAADLMLDFIRREMTADLVEDIASRLMIEGVRDGRLRQRLPTRMRYATPNRTVFSAIRVMEKNCYSAIPMREIARRTGVSQRQLERLFNAEFGKTPATVYKELRLGEARQDVIAGRRPLSEIAYDYGFEPAQFTRAYRQMFGSLPSADRKSRLAPMSQFAGENGDNYTLPGFARGYL